jgi:ABC-type enterochelin transport system permease subunit
MDIVWIILLIILISISIRELINTKKLPNNNQYNILQNSRYYRLLFIVIACSFAVITFIIKKIFF